MSEKVLVTPAELTTMLGKPDVVVIDTRAPDAYAAGHIPGAVNVHDIFTYLAMSTPEGMSELKHKFADIFGAAGLSGAETAVIYEGSMNTGFGQSCRGYFLLKFLGYPKAMVLHGGFAAWQAAGGAITTDPAAGVAKSFPLIDTGTSMMIGRDEMLAALDDSSIVMLDVRDVDEWVGDSSSPYGQGFLPAQGPHSRLEMDRVVPADEADPAGPDVQDAGRDHGGGAQRRHHQEHAGLPVLLQGRPRLEHIGGAQSEAGITDVRLYFGSFNEWSRDPALPVESGPPWAPVAHAPVAQAAE